MSLQRGINLRALAEKMGQCSGAEVRGICTEAGTLSFSVFSTLGFMLSFFHRHVRPPRTQTTRYTGGFRVCGGQGLCFILSCCCGSTLIVVIGLEKEPRCKY